MRSVHHDRIGLVAAALLSLAVGAGPALAVGTEEPPAPVTKPEDIKADEKKADEKKVDEKKPEQKSTDTKGTETKSDDKDKKPEGEKKSERDFRDGYRHAYALIYQKGDYAGGIAALKALGQDRHADVANLIGFASRKLGRYADAKTWYERALAADPNHARTWSYYGMWHAEQGNRLKAEDFLQKVASICGNTTCREYTELKGVIDGTATY